MYIYLKAFHIIAFTMWMAGMFYLPRLYVYHTETGDLTTRETFKVMERKLLRYIMNPAMIVTAVLGIAMVYQNTGWIQNGWLHAKLLLVVFLLGFHGYLAKSRKELARDEIRHTGKFWRKMNEVPTVLFILIVILATVKPF